MFSVFIAITSCLSIQARPKIARVPKIFVPKTETRTVKDLQPNGLLCDFCCGLVNGIEAMLTEQKNQEAITAWVQEQCKLLSEPYLSVCNTIASAYVPIIMELMQQGIHSLDICTKIGFCESKISKTAVAKENDLTCDMCQRIVNVVKEMIDSGKTEDEITIKIQGVCTNFPAPFDMTCTKTLIGYVPLIIKLVKQGEQAIKICEKIGFCFTSFPKMPRRSSAVTVKSCEFCMNTLDFAKALIEKGENPTAFQSKLMSYCSTSKAEFQFICPLFAHNYAKVIYDWILLGTEEQDICLVLSYCLPNEISQIRPKSRETKGSNGISCSLCQEAVSFVERQLEDHKVQEHIVSLLKEYCAMLPDALKLLCNQLADDYVPLIIEMLDKEIHAIDICKKLGYCDEISVQKQKAVARLPKGVKNLGDMCEFCKFLVDYIEDLLKDQKVESEIEALALKLCATLGDPYRATCETLVKQFVPLIIHWIESGLETSDICTKISLCGTAKQARILKQYNGISCSLCLQAVSFVKRQMEDHKVQEHIVALLKEYCAMLPDNLKLLCDQLADDYVPLIMKFIDQEMDGNQICKTLGYC